MTGTVHQFPHPEEVAGAGGPLRMPLFSLTGARPGPRLVVTGPDDVVRHLARVFWDMPELVRIRGSLAIRNDHQDPAHDLPDDVLDVGSNSVTAHLRVLGRMAALGMIEGRGVPRRWIN